MLKLNNKISLLELVQILSVYRQNIILNLHNLKQDYQRTGIKRVRGIRDINGDLITPCLETQDIHGGDFVQMGVFAINRNTATINMLVRRKVKLVKAEDNTDIIEVSGLLIRIFLRLRIAAKIPNLPSVKRPFQFSDFCSVNTSLASDSESFPSRTACATT